jgi:hypothetical protein
MSPSSSRGGRNGRVHLFLCLVSASRRCEHLKPPGLRYGAQLFILYLLSFTEGARVPAPPEVFCLFSGAGKLTRVARLDPGRAACSRSVGDIAISGSLCAPPTQAGLLLFCAHRQGRAGRRSATQRRCGRALCGKHCPVREPWFAGASLCSASLSSPLCLLQSGWFVR